MSLKAILTLDFLPDSRCFKVLWLGAILHALDIFCAFSAGSLPRLSLVALVLGVLGEAFRRLGIHDLPLLPIALLLTAAWPLWIILMFRSDAPKAERLWIPLFLGLALIGSRLHWILLSFVSVTRSFH